MRPGSRGSGRTGCWTPSPGSWSCPRACRPAPLVTSRYVRSRMFGSVTWPSSSCCSTPSGAPQQRRREGPQRALLLVGEGQVRETPERKGSRDRLFSAPVAVKSASAAATASSTSWRSSVVSTTATGTPPPPEDRRPRRLLLLLLHLPRHRIARQASSSMATLPTPAASASTASSPAGARAARRSAPGGRAPHPLGHVIHGRRQHLLRRLLPQRPLCLRARPMAASGSKSPRARSLLQSAASRPSRPAEWASAGQERGGGRLEGGE